MAVQNIVEDSNAGVIITEEDRKRRERIPKRATLINTCLFVPWIAYIAFLNVPDLHLETRTLLVTLPNALVNALRNPIIASLAFKVNEQIRQETVEDRRQLEIEKALKKRAERKRKIPNPSVEEGPQEQDQELSKAPSFNESIGLKPIGRYTKNIVN